MVEVKKFLSVTLIIFLGVAVGLLAMYLFKCSRIPLAVTTTTLSPTTTTVSLGRQQQADSETGAPVIGTGGEIVGVKCPTDYCLNPVQGAGSCPAWTGKTERYYEEECYDYPDSAESLVKCENNKVIYYKICGVRQS